MKITIDHIVEIDATYRQLKKRNIKELQYIDMSREHETFDDSLCPTFLQIMCFPWKFKHIRNIGDNIIQKRPGRINQFIPSEIEGIETFIEVYGYYNSYTIDFDPYMIRSIIRNDELECKEDILYRIITPLLLHAMTKGRQIQYEHCFWIEQGSTISVIIDSMKLDEMNVLCDFFGYELQFQRSVGDEIYASGRPALIEVTYKLVEIPGIETIKSDS